MAVDADKEKLILLPYQLEVLRKLAEDTGKPVVLTSKVRKKRPRPKKIKKPDVFLDGEWRNFCRESFL